MKTTQVTRLFACIQHRKAGMTIVLACALAGCGGGGNDAGAITPPVEAPVPAVGPGTWVVMGSSTAAGAGAPAGKGWVALVQAEYAAHGAQMSNIAKGGTVTYEGLSTTTQPVSGRPLPDPAINIDQALARKPVLLMVSYPTNDTASGYSTDETVNNILSIRALALAKAVPVIVTSTQPRNLTAAQLAQLQAIDQRVAASVGPCFVDVRTVLAGADGRLASVYDAGDGVHTNTEGHRLIAARVVSLLNNGQCVRL